MRWIAMNARLSDLPVYWKLLITGFLVLLLSGYFAAVSNAILSVGITPADISSHYGDNRLSQHEKEALSSEGFIEEEVSFEGEDEGHDMQMGEGQGHGDHNESDTLPAQVLAQVSHIHLLSFSLLLVAMGGVACLTSWSSGVKSAVVCVLAAALWGDIISLNLVRFVSGSFSIMTVLAGVTVGLCFALISLRALWEMWMPKSV